MGFFIRTFVGPYEIPGRWVLYSFIVPGIAAAAILLLHFQ